MAEFDAIDDFTKSTVDKFFDAMLDTEDDTTDSEYFAEMMEVLSFNKRWIYKGSMTTPPCEKFVYWNILTKIYPISQANLDKFKLRLGSMGDMPEGGNYRIIQRGFNKDVAYIHTGGVYLSVLSLVTAATTAISFF